MAEKKNILFILHLPPPVHGSSMVGKSIMDSELINSSFECRYVNLLMSRTINETGKPGLIKVLRFMRVWFSVLGEIIRKKPDLCYLALTASGTAFYKDFLLVLLLRIFRIKHIYHLHNKGVKQNQTSKLNNQLYRYVFSKAETILLSKQLYSDVESFVKESGVYFCPNGIKDTVMPALPRSCPENAAVKLLFLSNLMKSKGVYLLLDACSILMHKNLDFECNFVGGEGDISFDNFNKYLIDKGLNQNAKYLGLKFGAEKHKAFREADIFVHPTSNDCFPLVLLEAMQNQLPIISTFEGGIPDIVENDKTGFLIPANNAGALAEKLEILIKNPEMRQKMGSAGRLKFEKEFTLEIFEKNLHEILYKVSE